MRRNHRGFSLIELLVAMSIFSVIGIAIISLLAKSTEFSRSGTSTSETLDSLQTFTEAFTADAGRIYSRAESDKGPTNVRLWSDVVPSDVDGDEKPDGRVRRLAFVAMVPNEATDPVTRAAGAAVGGKDVVDQVKDLEEAAKGSLRATGGLMEVFWTAIPESKDDLAVLTLYRGVRTPIGGPGSFFPSKAYGPSALPAERGPANLPEVRAVARPLLGGVLYFGVDFWARRTESWDPTIVPPKGPIQIWDSTRGILRKGSGLDGFYYAKEAAAQGVSSVDDPTDDTFPRRMRVTLVVEETGQAARTGTLMQDIAPDVGTIELSDTKFIPASDTTQRFVKIGPEWIGFESVDGNRITGCRRGQRGTTAQAHSFGARVHHGRTVVREIGVATYRDAYRDELPTNVGR